MKFNFENRPKSKEKKQVQENIEEKKSLMEKVRAAAKPLFAYGLYFLASTGSFAQENNKKDTKKNPEIEIEQEDTQENKSNAIEPNMYQEGEFNYYHKSNFDTKEQFKEVIKNDPKMIAEGFFNTIALRKSNIQEHINLETQMLVRMQESAPGIIESFIDLHNEFPQGKKLSSPAELLFLDSYLENDCNVDQAKEALVDNPEYLELFRKDQEPLECLKEDETLIDVKYEKIKKNILEIEEFKNRMVEKIRSDTYLDRLTIELGGDIEKAKELQAERLHYLQSRDFYLSNHKDLVKKKNELSGAKGSAISYSQNADKNYIVMNNENSSHTSTHELSHLADEGGRNIPESTKKNT